MVPSEKKRLFILVAALAGITGCLIDLGATYILGSRIEGYHHLQHTMSQMGNPSSPVAKEIAVFWIVAGSLLVIFGAGIWISYKDRKPAAGIASLLVMLYGIGEGIASGTFPADKTGEAATWTGVVHNAISGMGVVAVMIFPWIMKIAAPGLRRISVIVFGIGTAAVVLFFISRYAVFPGQFPAGYKGAWQRLYMLDYYIYFIIVAVNMIARNRPGGKPGATV